MAEPMPRASSGSFFAPKRTRMIRRMMIKSGPPRLGSNASQLMGEASAYLHKLQGISWARPGVLCRRMSRLGQELRSLFDRQYRRAFRNLRHLPRLEYRFVIDAGANRGAFTDAFLQLHRPERMVLVEAIPELALKLCAKYEGNTRISIVSAALSDRNGEARFEINRSEASSSLLPIDPRNSDWFGRDLSVANSIIVPTLTLLELVTREKLESVDL